LTVCENGYGKRTSFGPNAILDGAEAEDSDEEIGSSARYRTQKRGGKGLRDIRTSERNGEVIGIARVTDEDEIFMMTGKGKIQRIKAADISVIGRNTQGVRIMNVDQGDQLVAVVRVPPEEDDDQQEQDHTAEAGQVEPASDSAPTDESSDSGSEAESE
ncbi:MAG: DNA gyrase subunit A, partial [Rubripirellula sp.]|nr:DNA gyrase subunit A [Rubripirellula sp.]